MSLDAFTTSLQNSDVATLIDGSRYIAMVVQAFHLLGLTFLLAVALAYNLRVLGLTLRTVPVETLARALHTPFLLTLAVAVAAGVLLFLPRATTYAHNGPFVWKMGLLLCAGSAQLLLLHKTKAEPEPTEATLFFRALSALTLVLWLSTGVAGRAIGFV